MNMSQGQQTATGVDPFALAMGMMSQMMAADAARRRSRDRDNAYAVTREANRAVNTPAFGGRSGPSKGSGGRKSGAKRRELQEGIQRRKEGRAKRREESIARNTAATAERQKEAKYRAAMRAADRLSEDIDVLGRDVDAYVTGVKEDRAAKATQASRDAYYGSQPPQQPLDALTLMGGTRTPQLMVLDARTPFTPPPGQTTEQVLGPDPMVDIYRQQDAARFAEAQDAVANRESGLPTQQQFEQSQAMPGPPPPTILTEAAAGNFPKPPTPMAPAAPAPQETRRTTPPEPGFFQQMGDMLMGRTPGNYVIPGVTPEEAATGSFRPVDRQGNPRPFNAGDSSRGFFGENPLRTLADFYAFRNNRVPMTMDPRSHGHTVGTYNYDRGY